MRRQGQPACAMASPLGRLCCRCYSSAAASSAPRPAAVAVIGAGWWSQGWHLPHLHRNPKATIAAIVDPTPHPTSPMNPDMKSVAELGELYGAPTFASLDELLAASASSSPAPLELDGVIVGTNHASHHELATKAMSAGLHVFCEKPMTVDIGQAMELVDLAKKSETAFMVNNTANWRQKSRQAQQMVEAGDIGEIRHASVLFHTPLAWVFDDPANTGWNLPSGDDFPPRAPADGRLLVVLD